MGQAPSYHGYRFPPEIISHAVCSITAFVSASAMRRICWRSAASRSPTKRFGSGVAPSGRRMHERCGATGANGRHVVPGRTVRHDPRAAAVSLAGRRRDRHPRAIPARSTCCHALLPEVVERPGVCTSTSHHGQAAELCVGSSRCDARPWSTSRTSTRTIELKSPISRRASASARCGASSRPPRCNASPRCTASYRISSGWVDICYGRLTTVCCEGKHSESGMR